MSDAKIRRITKLMNELNADGDVKNSGLETAYVANTYFQESLGSAGVPSGTKQIFVQSAAPTGWTKDTTHNNKAMRVVSGSVSSGGNDAFTTTFGSGKTTASHTLTISEMPAHTHSEGTIGAVAANSKGNFAGNVVTSGGAGTTGSTGGGGSHSHNLSGFDLQYVDVIIATKD